MRIVRDEVVQERIKSLKAADSLYVEELERYNEIVDTNLERTDFEGAPLGLPIVAVTDGLQSKYDILRINGSKFCIQVGDVEIETSPNIIRLLKALAIEQVSANSSYSYIVSAVFMQLLQSVIKGVEPVWKRPEGYTDYDYVYNEIVEWVKKEVCRDE